MYAQDCAVVFVHLGVETPLTLGAFSKLPQDFKGEIHKILITDNSSSFPQFNGRVIQRNDLSKAGKSLLAAKPFYSKVASGYWLNTFERLFALRSISELPQFDSIPIIHIETDVMPLFDSTDLQFLHNNFSKVAIPRFSETLGIGSFLFSPNLSELLNSLNLLEELVIKNGDRIENDMDLLGLALNNGILAELPSHPSDYDNSNYELVNNQRVLFDGAAFGQYLFGQDPFHQRGLRYSGFKNPAYVSKTNIDAMSWKIKSNEEKSDLIVEFDNIEYKIANIHVHSKEILPPLSSGNKRWRRAIDEGNGIIDRKWEQSSVVSPHSKKLTLFARFQIARNRGIVKTLVVYSKKRLSKAGCND